VVQCVEVAYAVGAENDGLVIDHELLAAVLQGRLHDPGISLGPVTAAAGDKRILAINYALVLASGTSLTRALRKAPASLE